jgi:hypothetical protein
MRSFGVFDTAVNSAVVNSFDPYFESGRENQYRFLERKLSDADHPIVLANRQENLRVKLNAAETS